MLYLLLYPLHETFSFLNVFRYITFRTVYAMLTALIASFILGPYIIRLLQKYQIGEVIRDDGPKNHFSKKGTPTMGGIFIIITLSIPTLLWADLSNHYIWIVLLSVLGFGLIGFYDDYIKVFRKKGGLEAKKKFFLQTVFSLVVSLVIYFDSAGDSANFSRLSIPFLKNFTPDLGILYVPFMVLILVAVSNAVNLTDGLDGLAIGPIIVATTAYMVISYVTGHAVFASYLKIIPVSKAGELTVFCGTVVGAGLGFLWFNSYPAEVFMGNVGSLALGGALGTVAILAKQELLLMVIGGIFVIEALSVIIQVGYFKWSGGKRVFKMAPIHHHFEECGWEEPKVIVRFWIVAVILALLSLSTLKLR